MISIIIPVLNEEKNLSKLFFQLSQMNKNIPHEIIVVDGGSSDRSVAIARQYATVYQLERANRGAQLQLGVEKSHGDIFWFLHGDSEIDIRDKDVLNEIEQATHNINYSAGFFELSFDSSEWFYRYLEKTSYFRAKYLGLIFGDQGMFTTRKKYEQAGGFDATPLMEDWDLSRRLRKLGKFFPVKVPIVTSSRRFRNGKFRTHVKMHKIKFLYLLGVSPKKLAERYYK